MTEPHPDPELGAAVLRRQAPSPPVAAIVLGTGLDGLASEVDARAVVDFEEIPGFPKATVEFHSGKIILGRLDDHEVVVMSGRFHYYEGYSLRQIAYPVRVFQRLGCRSILFTCAAGGLNPLYDRGDIVGIDDHINMLWLNPLIGPNDESEGPRFPDMSRPYDEELLFAAEKASCSLGTSLHRGVYAWVPGPCLETRAEYRFLRAVGADLVGMSIVPEVIAAVHGGMRVAALAVVTDMSLPDALKPIDVPAILETAAQAQPRLIAIIREVVASLGSPKKI